MTPPLSHAFAAPVRAFSTPVFVLAEDLDWLGCMRACQAPVAAVLHAARITEALARSALVEASLWAPQNGVEAPGLNDALRRLVGYGSVSAETYRLLDRLRDLGNKARHVLRRLREADAEVGYAIALRAVHWYFCEFPDGPTLKTLTVPGQSLDDLLPVETRTLLDMLRDEVISGPGFVTTLRLDAKNCPLLASPVLAAVLAEKLLDRDRAEEAQAVLTAALGRFPDDVRLRQLQGLHWSRMGRLAEACEWLESIGPADAAADEETQGILAGAFKRRADADPTRRDEWRRRSQQVYEQGWRRSGDANGYLGINAAATALWLKQPGHERIATGVRALMQERKRSLSPRPLHFWDAVTLAEANLLLRRWDEAREGYAAAWSNHPHEKQSQGVARTQAEKDLAALGRPDLLGTILPS